jgi:hypothetical protein
VITDRIFHCPAIPIDRVANDGHELWIEMPDTWRYRLDYLGALMENISRVGCDPIRAYENPDGLILGLSGINRFQAIKKLGWKTFPSLFFASSRDVPAKYTDDIVEVTPEQARSLVRNRVCTSVVEHGGYSYEKSFEPIDFLMNFDASRETQERMFTCFFLENLQNQCWGHSRTDLEAQLVEAVKMGLSEYWQDECRSGLEYYK